MGAEAAVLVEGMAAMQRTKQRGSGAKAADNKNNTHLRSRGSCPLRKRQDLAKEGNAVLGRCVGRERLGNIQHDGREASARCAGRIVGSRGGGETTKGRVCRWWSGPFAVANRNKTPIFFSYRMHTVLCT